MSEFTVEFRECTYVRKASWIPPVYSGVSMKLSTVNHKSKNQCDNYRSVVFFYAPQIQNRGTLLHRIPMYANTDRNSIWILAVCISYPTDINNYD